MSDIPDPKIIRSRRRTIALQVLPDASIIVRAPLRISLKEIEKFIYENIRWIEEHLKKVKSKPKPTLIDYKDGESFFFLGKKYKLEIGLHDKIQIKDDRLLFPIGLNFRIQKDLQAWYIKQAKNIISTQVDYFAEKMNTSYLDIQFSDTKSQWGRCTHDNRLQFSWRLVMAPMLVLNYVVVHELAHTIHKNHSSSFWSKVRLFNPSYKQNIKWLKDHGSSLKF